MLIYICIFGCKVNKNIPKHQINKSVYGGLYANFAENMPLCHIDTFAARTDS